MNEGDKYNVEIKVKKKSNQGRFVAASDLPCH